MRTSGATLAFVAASVSSAVILAFPLGGLSGGIAWAAFAIGLATAAVAWLTIQRREMPAVSAWDILMLSLFALVSLRAFLWLIYPVGDEWRVLSPNNLGDLSLHIHFIRYLAGGVAFWPASPILAGAPLTYPVGMDLLNAMLFSTGVPVEKGLVWIGLLGAVLSGWALWRWGGAFAIAAFLFNGGLAGFVIFQNGQVSDFQAELAWKNFFLSMFVTQRGLLYALPCGLFLMSVWRDDLFGNGSGVPHWIVFLLYATMPLFNAHAFVFLSLVLAAAFVVNPLKRKSLAAFVALAFVPATAAMFLVTGRFSALSGLRWLPGWMQAGEGWMFWVWNFGISLPLLLVLAVSLIRKPRPASICFAGTGLFVFLLCFLVSFAPWEWDNTKLFLWAWLACAPFLWELIKRWPVTLRVITCILLFFSGAVSLAGGLDGRHGYKLASRSELAVAAETLRKVPLKDRIAVEPDFNNPVILLGRPVLCGYEGHLWSHGLNYRKQWDELQLVLKRAPGWKQALEHLNAEWIFLKGTPPILIPLSAPSPE
ncbi:MAG: hypothetical protein ACOYM3_11640 [Terrimicrobiaceae bacterium]